MTLYFTTNRIKNPLTGGEKYVQALLEGASAAGFKVQIWEAVNLPWILKTIPLMNIIHCLKILKADKNSILMIDLDFHFRYFLSVPVARFLKKMKVVGVLFHYNYSFKKRSLKRTIQYNVERFVSRQCDFLITLSTFSLHNFIRVSNKTVPNVILQPYVKQSREEDAEVSRRFSEENRFLLVGNIEYRKNVDTVLRALGTLNCSFRFDIAGQCVSEQYRCYLQNLIRELKLGEKVHFHGRVSSEQLANLYNGSSLFILVSRMEGFGIVYAEAMKYGLPIVASNTGAVPEIVENGKNGILCDPEDPDAISKAILKIINNQELRNTFSENNYRKFKSFIDRSAFVEKATEIFKSFQV